MVGFPDWCDQNTEVVGTHTLHGFSARPADIALGRAAVAAVIPGHYAAEEQVAGILRRLGRPKSAAFIENKLPTTKSIRSGDLGEILATEYIVTHTHYGVPIKRLRWRDHRNMAMRGEDVIGMIRDPATGRLRFLKAEAKSRVALASSVVGEARVALDKDGGLPSAHALMFVSARLLDARENIMADAIDDALWKYGIAPQSVEHLLFTFSGNDPTGHLRGSLQAYSGAINQICVGVRVEEHCAFIADVYDLVMADANNG